MWMWTHLQLSSRTTSSPLQEAWLPRPRVPPRAYYHMPKLPKAILDNGTCSSTSSLHAKRWHSKSVLCSARGSRSTPRPPDCRDLRRQTNYTQQRQRDQPFGCCTGQWTTTTTPSPQWGGAQGGGISMDPAGPKGTEKASPHPCTWATGARWVESIDPMYHWLVCQSLRCTGWQEQCRWGLWLARGLAGSSMRCTPSRWAQRSIVLSLGAARVEWASGALQWWMDRDESWAGLSRDCGGHGTSTASGWVGSGRQHLSKTGSWRR